MQYSEFEKWILNNKEGHVIDFKEGCLVSNSADIALDVASFANANGGDLVYGVNDNKEFTGCTNFVVSRWMSLNAEQIENGLRNKLNGHWTHPVLFEIQVIDDCNKRFLRLTVFQANTLTGFIKKRNDPNCAIQYWKRIGRQKLVMNHAEIVAAAEQERFRTNRQAIETTFAEHLLGRMKFLYVSIFQAYGYTCRIGEIRPSRLDSTHLSKFVPGRRGLMGNEAASIHDELKGLSFLGLSLDDDLKKVVMILLNALKTIVRMGAMLQGALCKGENAQQGSELNAIDTILLDQDIQCCNKILATLDYLQNFLSISRGI
jgi:Putative DNA-binding domain